MPTKKSKQKPIEPLAVTKDVAAKLLSLSIRTIDRLIENGSLRNSGLPRKALIPMEDIRGFINRNG